MQRKYSSFRINRLFAGKASLRDNQVRQVVEKGNNLIIRLDDGKMTIPYREVKKSLEGNEFRREIKSKFIEGMTYTLIDFDWKPDRETEQIQVNPNVKLELRKRMGDKYDKIFK